MEKEFKTKVRADGVKMEGYFIGDMPFERGTIYYSDNFRYEGRWNQKGPCGRGVLIFSGDEEMRIEGVFDGVEPVAQEPARVLKDGTLVYEGTLDGDLNPHGMGVRYGELRREEGQFEHGERTGSGKIYMGDVLIYDGEWAEDEDGNPRDYSKGFFYTGGKLTFGVWLGGNFKPVSDDDAADTGQDNDDYEAWEGATPAPAPRSNGKRWAVAALLLALAALALWWGARHFGLADRLAGLAVPDTMVVEQPAEPVATKAKPKKEKKNRRKAAAEERVEQPALQAADEQPARQQADEQPAEAPRSGGSGYRLERVEQEPQAPPASSSGGKGFRLERVDKVPQE